MIYIPYNIWDKVIATVPDGTYISTIWWIYDCDDWETYYYIFWQSRMLHASLIEKLLSTNDKETNKTEDMKKEKKKVTKEEAKQIIDKRRV